MNKLFSLLLAVGMFFIISPPEAWAQQTRADVFQQVKSLEAEAKAQKGDVVSPKTFEDGVKHLEKAEKVYDKGGEISKIKSELAKAEEAFNECIETSRVADVMFEEALEARTDASSAGAATAAEDLWQDAEDDMQDAGKRLEKGKSEKAKRQAEKATEQYREAELEAICNNTYGDIQQTLEEGDDMKADKKAEKTYEDAENKVEEGLESLSNERYDNQKAQQLAEDAAYQANHAIALTNSINQIEEEKMSYEDILLKEEEDLQSIADVLGTELKFDNGREAALQQLKDEITLVQGEVTSLRGEIESMNAASADSEAAMRARIEETKAKLNQIFNMFDEDKVEVFEQKGKFILRMKGFNFDVGSAEIGTDNYELLTQVQEAVNIFPNEKIIVEGHTDATGGEELNQELSEKRAEAVKQYLQANMTNGGMNIEAKGYGESKPISSNETEEGRQDNRRIDIVIDTALGE
ncbi:OmpA family protein [Algivirga pacifica]|uniref:OmpA-like domain-containing protein n=1 Tax=Algivirga pacifica TaxID=1162670 RepID=A0ABP9D421_9BACT